MPGSTFLSRSSFLLWLDRCSIYRSESKGLRKKNLIDRTIRLGNKRWRLREVDALPAKRRGDCDDPQTPRKQIRLLASLQGRDRLEILLHEFFHALAWDLDESWVEVSARDVAKILYDLGYRDHDNST